MLYYDRLGNVAQIRCDGTFMRLMQLSISIPFLVCVTAHGATVVWDNLSCYGSEVLFSDINAQTGRPWSLDVMYSCTLASVDEYVLKGESANLLFAGNWLSAANGDIVSETATRHLDHYFYSQFMDDAGTGESYAYSADLIKVNSGETFYLMFCVDMDYPSLEVIYGWVELYMNPDGTISYLHSAYDLDGGPMVVGGGAWTGGIPEPSGGILLLLGVAALGLRRGKG